MDVSSATNIDVDLNPASRDIADVAEISDHNISLLRSGAKEARDFVDSLLKHCEILEKEAELRAEASVVSTSSAYRILLLETEADRIAREAITKLENCRKCIMSQSGVRFKYGPGQDSSSVKVQAQNQLSGGPVISGAEASAEVAKSQAETPENAMVQTVGSLQETEPLERDEARQGESQNTGTNPGTEGLSPTLDLHDHSPQKTEAMATSGEAKSVSRDERCVQDSSEDSGDVPLSLKLDNEVKKRGPGSGSKPPKRIVIEDRMEDGWKWRKYGQKATRNSSFPRSYYRCRKKCGATRQVERYAADPSKYRIVYQGSHSHSMPEKTFREAMAADLESLIGAQIQRFSRGGFLEGRARLASLGSGEGGEREAGLSWKFPTPNSLEPPGLGALTASASVPAKQHAWTSPETHPANQRRALPPLPTSISQAFGDFLRPEQAKASLPAVMGGGAALGAPTLASLDASAPQNDHREEKERPGGGEEDVVLSLGPSSEGSLRPAPAGALGDEYGGSRAVGEWRSLEEQQDCSTPRIVIDRRPYAPPRAPFVDDKISPTFLECMDSPIYNLSSPFMKTPP